MLEDKIRSFRGRTAKVLGHENAFKSAVLVPLVKIDGEFHILFEKRALSLRRQPGEICFPGGQTDPDDHGAKATALRESCEELGIPPQNIEIIAPLDVMVSAYNAIIIPYLAYIKELTTLKVSTDEVAKVLYIPLSFFMENEPDVHYTQTMVSAPDDFPFHLIPHGRDYPFRTGRVAQYFYIWQDEVIWGLTAAILYHFIRLMKQ